MADDTKKLLLQIDASVELLKRNLRQGDSHVARFEADTKRRLTSIDRSFTTLGRGVDTLRGRFSAFRAMLATVGIVTVLHGIQSLIRGSFELGSSLGETAQQLGVSTRALQVYRYVGGQVGIAQETMDRSLGKLNKTLGEAALGTAPRASEALRRFGFSLAEIRRGLTVEQVMPRLADGLSRVESSSRRAAIETMFFGRAGQALDTMLTGGSARINELAEAADRLGIVLSDEQIDRLDEAHDKYDALKTVLSARIAGVVADNADSILQLVSALGELIRYAGMAGDAWRNIRLELQAQRLENSLSSAASTPPEWGVGGRGRQQTPQERMSTLEQIQAIRQEQLEIARRRDPAYRPPAPPAPPRRPPRPDAPDLDDLSGSTRTRTRERTNAQGLADFRAALARRGIHQNPGSGTGFRTQAQQNDFRRRGLTNAPVSDHTDYRGLDVPLGASEEDIRAAAVEAGVRLRPGRRGILREPTARGGPHTHLAIESYGRRGDVSGAIEEQEREAEQALREQAQFDSDMRRAHVTVLTLQRDLSTDYTERATLSTRILDQEREQEFASLQLSVTMGERTQAQVDQLEAEYDVADALRRQQIIVEEQNQRREEYERLQAVSLEIQRSILQGEADLSTTAAERRAVELRILDLAYQEERARLQRIIALNRHDADEEEARRRLEALPGQHAQQQEQTRRSTRGPLEEYRATLPRTAAEVNEALERVAANGLQALNDGIVDAIMGAKSLGAVFKAVAKQIIADLIRIAVQRAIIEPLANSLFGAPGSTGGGSFGNLIASLGSLFGGPRAIGGDVSPNRIYRVGERGTELFQPKVPGSIIPNHALGRGGGGRDRLDVFIHPTEEFDARVVRTAAGVVGEATPRIAAHEASKALAGFLRRGLP